MNHSSRTHAKYPPSGMHRWARCPGSVRLLETVPPRPPSEWSIDGTRAHELLQYALNKALRSVIELEGIKIIDDFGHVIEPTEAHCQSVQTVLDHVNEILDENSDASIYVERKLTTPQSVVSEDECGGTLDIAIVIPSMQFAHVIDFKHGAGIVIEIEDAKGRKNEQLWNYGYTFVMNFPTPITKVELTIIQPRTFHPAGLVRSKTVSIAELLDFRADLEDALRRCIAEDAPLVPGPIQCQWCDAHPVCPAVQQQALTTINAAMQDVRGLANLTLPPVVDLGLDRLAYILQAKKFIIGWLDECETYALEQARAGKYVPGFKLVQALARRKWHGDPAEVARAFMGSTACTLDEIYPRKLIGVTEAEAFAKRTLKERAPRGKKKEAAEQGKELVAFLTLKQSSGETTLAPETDARPAVNIADQFVGVNLPQVTLQEST